LRARITGSRRNRAKQMTSLIEEFQYPKLGPGMMWETCRDLVEKAGVEVLLESPVVGVERGPAGATAVVFEHEGGRYRVETDHVISSMPFSELVRDMDPPAPADVRAAALTLQYRDFLTVALVVPDVSGFPDNWIYIHSPKVQVGRIQNFGAWSPFMVRAGTTCLGMEYFVFEGDELWDKADDELVALATRELAAIGLIEPTQVQQGYVVRMPKAYPVYDDTYRAAVDTMREWLAASVPNVHPVGRNGMHKYNNQDHSMYTAMLTVDNIVEDAGHDIWSVNVDEEYHEETSEGRVSSGTGRDAPVVPRKVAAASGGGAS
jgi:protoporphyrinogen oxidase